jgi:protein-disulfide isomerase
MVNDIGPRDDGHFDALVSCSCEFNASLKSLKGAKWGYHRSRVAEHMPDVPCLGFADHSCHRAEQLCVRGEPAQGHAKHIAFFDYPDFKCIHDLLRTAGEDAPPQSSPHRILKRPRVEPRACVNPIALCGLSRKQRAIWASSHSASVGWIGPLINLKSSKLRLIAILFAAESLAIALPNVVGAQAAQPVQAVELKRILANPGVAALGSSHSDVNIVEYFDYNCPFCKKLAPAFKSLVATDHKVAVIYKDWPIFGGVSVYAAQCALAAQWQGKYLQAHDALMTAPRLAQNEQVDAALQRSDIDMARLKKDLLAHGAMIDALLARNHSEALALKLPGTPGIIVGGMLVPGIQDLGGLQSVVTYARLEK